MIHIQMYFGHNLKVSRKDADVIVGISHVMCIPWGSRGSIKLLSRFSSINFQHSDIIKTRNKLQNSFSLILFFILYKTSVCGLVWYSCTENWLCKFDSRKNAKIWSKREFRCHILHLSHRLWRFWLLFIWKILTLLATFIETQVGEKQTG